MKGKKLPPNIMREAGKTMRPMIINGKLVDWEAEGAKADAMLAAFGMTKP